MFQALNVSSFKGIVTIVTVIWDFHFQKVNHSFSFSLWHVAHHKLLNADGEGCRVEQNLAFLVQEADYILNKHHKVLREQFICLEEKNK